MIIHKARAQELLDSGVRPAQIARELGISRQYVYQLLGKVGRPLPRPPKCSRCGKEFQREPSTHRMLCEECCSLHARVNLTCPNCGVIFSLTPSDVRNRMKFRQMRGSTTDISCSASCSMKWRYRKDKEGAPT